MRKGQGRLGSSKTLGCGESEKLCREMERAPSGVKEGPETELNLGSTSKVGEVPCQKWGPEIELNLGSKMLCERNSGVKIGLRKVLGGSI